MKENFLNKKICFLGDSIVQNGGFIACLRSYFYEQKCSKMPLFFNCGLGGNRSNMAKDLLEDEVFSYQPEYCFVMYGVNDMGIWLYDSALEETGDLLTERKQRDDMFLDGIKQAVQALKAKGIQPVIISPCAVNERIIEKEHIQTVADNKEKGELIDDSFYKRKTFERINAKLRWYSKTLREYANEEGIGLVDVFAQMYLSMQTEEDLFGQDGIHLTEKGHEELAKIILRYLGVETIPQTIQRNEYSEKIAETEKIERSIQYVKWAMFHPIFGYDVLETEQNAVALLQEEDLPRHRKAAIENYLKYNGKTESLRAKILQSMKEY